MTAQNYTGSCHCGKVSYEVEVSLDNSIACNCSVCSKRGSILAFAPEDKFNLISGEGNTTDYQFNKHVIHHLFCKTCGILSFARGTDPKGNKMVAINVRCLDGVNLEALTVTPVNGKAF